MQKCAPSVAHETFVIDASPRLLGGVLNEDGAATSYISELVSKDGINVLVWRSAQRHVSNSSKPWPRLCPCARGQTQGSSRRSWRQRHSCDTSVNFQGRFHSRQRVNSHKVAAPAYKPMVSEHIPGVADVTADDLSCIVASMLVEQAPTVVRPRSWYRAHNPVTRVPQLRRNGTTVAFVKNRAVVRKSQDTTVGVARGRSTWSATPRMALLRSQSGRAFGSQYVLG